MSRRVRLAACSLSVLYVIDHTAQVPSPRVGRDDHLALDVLAVDGVGAHGGLHVSHVGEGYLVSVRVVYHQVADMLHAASVVLGGAYHEVEGLAGEGREGDAVAGEHVALGGNLELGTLDLLLHVEVGDALDSADGAFDPVAYDKHLVEIVSEQFDGYAGLCSAEHGVYTVADGLAYLDVGSADGREFLAYFIKQFRVGTVFQYERSLDL